jgi:hypothetical protein
MWSAFAVLLIFWVMGVVMGQIDARDIDEGLDIDHAHRARVVLIIAGLILAMMVLANYAFGSVSWRLLLMATEAYAVFTITDRHVLNCTRKSPPVRYDYIGPSIRGRKDSWYDGLWWSLTRKVERVYITHEELRTVYARTGFSPYWTAVIFEAAIGLVSFILLISNS